MSIRIKKNKLFFLIFLLFIFAFFAFAQDLEVTYPVIPGAPLTGEPTLPEYIRFIYNFSIIIAGLVAFFSLVYGGFRYLTSVGQAAAMADARAQITAGIVGLMILLGSYLFLVTVNPQLTIFRLAAPPPPVLVAPEPIPIQLTAETYDVYEIPIGRLIENALEPGRLNTIKNRAGEIKRISGEIRNKADNFLIGIQDCNNCGNTEPNLTSCKFGESCPAGLSCQGDPCLDRDAVLAIKEEIKALAGDLANEMEKMLGPLTSLKKDGQRLQLGVDILKETIYPINYDSFLEIKQVILEIGGEVRIIPFIVLGQTIRGRGDPATFYTDEERVTELLAAGLFPTFPQFDTLAVCDECEIDIHYTNIDIPTTTKDKMAAQWPSGKIKASCPGGVDCWDYVINWAKANGWNPVFLLALWGEESGFSTFKIALGCDPGGTLGFGGDIVGQLQCFAGTTDPVSGNCRPGGICEQGNTELCGFIRCWGGFHVQCNLSDNPNFWPVLFDMYMSLLPSEIDPALNPAAPSGNCTLTAPEALPPGLAGCPLDPTDPSFGLTCGWGGYPGHRAVDLDTPDDSFPPVFAVVDGTIFATGSASDPCGIEIRLDTGGFGTFRYCHLQSTIIPLGTSKGVLKGDVVGFADGTGGVPFHLHFALFESSEINPEHAKPIECLGIECIDNAPDLTAGICINGEALDPNLCL